MEMDDTEVEQLIEAVRQNGALWNTFHPLYGNVKKKSEVWRKVGKQLNLPDSIVKRKWKSLRDSYTRNLHKQKCLDVDSNDPNSFGKYGESMCFIKDHIKIRKSKRRRSPSPVGSEKTTSREKIQPSPEIKVNPFECNSLYDFEFAEDANPLPTDTRAWHVTENLPSDEITEKHNDTRVSQRNIKRRKIKVNTIEESLMSTMQSVQEFLKKPREAASSSSNNVEDEFFCRSLLEKLLTFPTEVRNQAKLGMMKYLCSIQGKLLRRQS